MDDVGLHLEGEVAADGAGGGLHRVGGAGQRAERLDGARPLDDLVAQFGGIPVPGAQSSGPGAQGGAATTPGAAQSAPSSRYQQCLQDAGSDVAKLQQCQELVGQ